MNERSDTHNSDEGALPLWYALKIREPSHTF